MDLWEEKRQELFHQGVTVIPILDCLTLSTFHEQFLQEVKTFPEYIDENEPRVYGSFGALGNPASFHNPTVRKLRMGMMEYARYLFRKFPAMTSDQLWKQANIEQLIDRMSIRRTSTQVPKETWHRDIASNKNDNDEIFGGWINLDVDQTQYFSCILKSHRSQDFKGESGFQRSSFESNLLQSDHRIVEVPPGSWIIFYQNIIHEVHSKRIVRDSIRLYLGFRLTDSTTPLYDMKECLLKQGVPIGPSGQTPEMFFANHLRFHGQQVRDWSVRAFKPVCRDGDVVHRVMKSLYDYGLPMYSSYTEEEKAILTPTRLD